MDERRGFDEAEPFHRIPDYGRAASTSSAPESQVIVYPLSKVSALRNV